MGCLFHLLALEILHPCAKRNCKNSAAAWLRPRTDLAQTWHGPGTELARTFWHGMFLARPVSGTARHTTILARSNRGTAHFWHGTSSPRHASCEARQTISWHGMDSKETARHGTEHTDSRRQRPPSRQVTCSLSLRARRPLLVYSSCPFTLEIP